MTQEDGGKGFDRVLYFLLGLIIAALVAVYGLIRVFELTMRPELGMELLKAVVQILTVLVLGQVATFLVKLWEADRAQTEKERDRERARRDARREMLRDWHGRLIGAYVAVKGHRRILRAHGLNPPMRGKIIVPETVVKRASYDDALKGINDVEGDLNLLQREIAGSLEGPRDAKEAVRNDADADELERLHALARHVGYVRDYLGDLIEQYEQHFSQDPDLILAQIDDAASKKTKKRRPDYKPGFLGDFLASTRFSPEDGRTQRQSHFKLMVLDRFQAAAEALQQAIVNEPARLGWREPQD